MLNARTHVTLDVGHCVYITKHSAIAYYHLLFEIADICIKVPSSLLLFKNITTFLCHSSLKYSHIFLKDILLVNVVTHWILHFKSGSLFCGFIVPGVFLKL